MTPLIALAFIPASADTYNCINGDETVVVEHKNNLAYPRCISLASTHPNGFLFNCLTEAMLNITSSVRFKHAVKVVKVTILLMQ